MSLPMKPFINYVNCLLLKDLWQRQPSISSHLLTPNISSLFSLPVASTLITKLSYTDELSSLFGVSKVCSV